jgi:hypothetical protein
MSVPLFLGLAHDRGRSRVPPEPRPTLVQLHRSHCWTWVYCEKCLHHAPMALVPLTLKFPAPHLGSDYGRPWPAARNNSFPTVLVVGNAGRNQPLPAF